MPAPLHNHNHTKHGGSGTRLYSIWKTMRQRCNNPNCNKYKNYGARGIKICNEWNNFAVFRSWALSNGYSSELSIDRIDVNGNYNPQNCKWSTVEEQENNRTTNVYIKYNGELLTMARFCRKYNLKYKHFAKLHKDGVDINKAMLMCSA